MEACERLGPIPLALKAYTLLSKPATRLHAAREAAQRRGLRTTSRGLRCSALRNFGVNPSRVDPSCVRKARKDAATRHGPGLKRNQVWRPLVRLFSAQRFVALFLPSSCNCFSMPLASRCFCIGAIEPSG